MRIVITGADGFIARNLKVRLCELSHIDVVDVTRQTPVDSLPDIMAGADIVFHLAGANRPKEIAGFSRDNVGFTRTLCAALNSIGNRAPIVYASSTHAALETPYGVSKRKAEDLLIAYSRDTGAPVHILRLTNIFGKWARPNYNSAVSTFCHNVARNLPIVIDDRNASLRLIYIDDLVSTLIELLSAAPQDSGRLDVGPIYHTTVGEVADIIHSFAQSRSSLVTPQVGLGLLRALYATYLSYVPPTDFCYRLTSYVDERGEFVEMLKTRDSGQFSYFTAHPGVTRGEHYHHSKSEKFLVIRGSAQFGFRNVDTGEMFQTIVRGGDAKVVETAPGWAHNITNIGKDELVVMLWASEIFDREKPDTVASKVVR